MTTIVFVIIIVLAVAIGYSVSKAASLADDALDDLDGAPDMDYTNMKRK